MRFLNIRNHGATTKLKYGKDEDTVLHFVAVRRGTPEHHTDLGMHDRGKKGQMTYKVIRYKFCISLTHGFTVHACGGCRKLENNHFPYYQFLVTTGVL